MLYELNVTIMECIVINELLEWHGIENLHEAGTEVEVTSLVRTESVDRIPRSGERCFLLCNPLSLLSPYHRNQSITND